MRREVRQMLGLLAVPVTVWIFVSSYYTARSWSNLGFQIKEKRDLQVSTHLVGTIFVNAFPDEMVSILTPQSDRHDPTIPGPITWKSDSYHVQFDPDKNIVTVKSGRFLQDAQLKYDGWRWCGFANIPNRKSPIKVDVW